MIVSPVGGEFSNRHQGHTTALNQFRRLGIATRTSVSAPAAANSLFAENCERKQWPSGLHRRQRGDGCNAIEAAARRRDGHSANLTETAANGGAVPAVLEALNRADAERRALMVELARPTAVAVFTWSPTWTRVESGGNSAAYVDDWHGCSRPTSCGRRKLFDLVLRERIRFRPVERKDGPGYE